MERVAQIPSVESVGIVENLPLVERVGQWRVRTPDMTDAEGAGQMVGRT